MDRLGNQGRGVCRITEAFRATAGNPWPDFQTPKKSSRLPRLKAAFDQLRRLGAHQWVTHVTLPVLINATRARVAGIIQSPVTSVTLLGNVVGNRGRNACHSPLCLWLRLGWRTSSAAFAGLLLDSGLGPFDPKFAPSCILFSNDPTDLAYAFVTVAPVSLFGSLGSDQCVTMTGDHRPRPTM